MPSVCRLFASFAFTLLPWAVAAEDARPLTLDEAIAASSDEDWYTPEPENLLVLELPGGRVLMELAPDFAPRHVDNIRILVRERYFDGLAILRVQDNYVVQWGDPMADRAVRARTLGMAEPTLQPEFERAMAGLPFVPLRARDAYAPETGFSVGFRVGLDAAAGRTWLVHCYGALGVARDVDADSGSGAGLYAVIGHAPRHLDRNITLVGQVREGMDVLASLPRGPAPMGFHSDAAARVPLVSMRLATDLPEAERPAIEVMRTDTPAFARVIESRRHRHEPWFHHPVGGIDICNVPIPVRRVVRAPHSTGDDAGAVGEPADADVDASPVDPVSA